MQDTVDKPQFNNGQNNIVLVEPNENLNPYGYFIAKSSAILQANNMTLALVVNISNKPITK